MATNVEGNKLTGVMYNLTGITLTKGKQALINIKTEHKIQIADVVAGNSQGKSIETAIDDGSSLTPDKFIMHHNYPNPFKQSTTIEYALAKKSKVGISVYNIRGQLVRRYKQGEQSSGFYNLVWDGKNNHGSRVGNGIYLFKIKADIINGGNYSKVRKALFIK